MEERFDLGVLKERKRSEGVGTSILVSVGIHLLLVIWMVRSYEPVRDAAADVPIARYVELMRQNDDRFTEAPGPKLDRAPLNAPLSDGNRRASSPEPPSGERPTQRPGEGGGLYTPPTPPPGSAGQRPQQAQQAQQPSRASMTNSPAQDPGEGFVYRQSSQPTSIASAAVDWRSAIRDVGRAGDGNGAEGLDLGQLGSGEKGFWEQGPLSFETQWFDWGDYAQAMVSKIRVNWYANMPHLIRSGIKGVVRIRFTIHRDGRISDVVVLSTSEVPPYDYAARKAIELSSPLASLPANFPNPSERVTASFYYNMQVPGR